jgi:glutathione synthase/RimK-type ligase-like ATP-grasp enzyme
MIALLTRQHDLTADLVVHRLLEHGCEFVRINVDQLLSSCWLEVADSSLIYSDESGQQYDLATVKSVWYRTHERPLASTGTDHAANAFIGREALAQLFGSMLATGAQWINHPATSWSASQKPLQLQVARQCGLAVPRTLITRRPDAAREFVRSAPEYVVTKPVSHGLVEQAGRPELSIYTTRISRQQQDYDAVALAPVILQYEISKRSDVRVTIVGDKVFSVAIDSQAQLDTSTDWRRPAEREPALSIIDLPGTVRDGCLRLLRSLGLTFGAIDLIHSDSDEYFFLEVNPTGQWGWLEVQLKLPISTAVVSVLTDGVR